jgi:PEGA domain
MRALVVAILATAGANLASADDHEQEAVRHLNLGIAAYKLGHYDEALRELAETERLAPDRANTHRWFAIVYAKIGDCKSALAHVDGYMAHASETDKRLPEIVELRDRCLGNATLLVRSTPAGANIRLDGGAVVGTTPYRALGVHGGSHVVGVDLPGYDPVSRPVTMPATGQLVLDIDLVQHAPPTPASHSRWWIWAAGGAAALAIIGVTYAATRDHGNQLPPIVCDPGACR